MRILHIYKDYSPVVGGIENHIRDLAEAQAESGHDVTVLVTSRGASTTSSKENGVRVLRARSLTTLASTPLSLELALLIRQCECDITHLHSPYPLAEAAWLALGKEPMVLTYHSDVVRQRLLGALWAPFLRRVLKRADRVLATSPRYVESSPFLRAVRDHVSVVPLGIDVEPFVAARRHAPASGSNAYKLAFVGRLRYYKGLEVLIDALGDLPNAQLLVVGTGPMELEWRRRAALVGVADRVSWLGFVPDSEVPGILASCDVYVLPATERSEAYGIALLEGMAAGLPAVTTELGTGTSWLNQDGHTGLVVPPKDSKQLAAALGYLLDDHELRAAMGRSARQRVLDEFTQGLMIRRVLQVYREVIA